MFTSRVITIFPKRELARLGVRALELSSAFAGLILAPPSAQELVRMGEISLRPQPR